MITLHGEYTGTLWLMISATNSGGYNYEQIPDSLLQWWNTFGDHCVGANTAAVHYRVQAVTQNLLAKKK